MLKGTRFVDKILVPYGGAGKHNDMYDSQIEFFDYNSAVKVISQAMLEDVNVGERESGDIDIIDSSGFKTAKLLGINQVMERSSIDVMFSRDSLYQGVSVQ